MRARAPLDVDLEDKLIYGLTPMRLAYVVVGLLGGYALWSCQWMPSPLRGTACFLVVGIGIAAAWGRWRGRALDAWVADFSIFALNTRRVAWDDHRVDHLDSRPARPPNRGPVVPVAVVVAGRAPKAGATTVANELASCLAAGADEDRLWSVTTAPVGCEESPTASRLLLSVAAVDAGRVCYLDRGAGPFVAALIPEDEYVPQAAALSQATVAAFPDAPASRAFRELAEVIAAAG